ncbi:MAG: hypothetical protein COA50_04060 [Flavobacteriaceae bacterium]|nr:MAG: hypothetical protein COA50_04060 [Flavobacteriaceae bacterium]
MSEEITNRVAQSKLVTFDLEELYPEGKRILFDIKDWLHEGFILKEKEFRKSLDEYSWESHKNQYVGLICSSDAIIPGWAYMLIATKLQPYAKKVIVGNLEQLETALYQSIIERIDLSVFKDKAVIIKGCSNKPVPENAYLLATTKIQEVAKSIMYGEACSSVPLYKRRKF